MFVINTTILVQTIHVNDNDTSSVDYDHLRKNKPKSPVEYKTNLHVLNYR